MSRVDIPTLKCDRCGTTTQDTREMVSYLKLTYSHMGGVNEWDICPVCWIVFNYDYLGGSLTDSGDRSRVVT